MRRMVVPERADVRRVLLCCCLGLAGFFVICGWLGGSGYVVWAADKVEVTPVEEVTVAPVESSGTEGSGASSGQEGSSEALQDEILSELSSELDLDESFDLFASYEAEVKALLPDFSLENFFQGLLKGEGSGLDFSSVLKGILNFVLKSFVVNGPLISKLIMLAVFCAVLNQLQTAFDGQVSQVARLLCVFVLIGMAVTAYRVALEVATQAIDSMVAFMQAIMPVMFSLLVATGNLTSSALFKPVVMGSLTVLATILKTVVLPLFFLAVALKLFNNVSQQFKMDKLASLLEAGGKIGIGLVMTIFLGIMTVNGVSGGVADGVSVRAAKYSADLIPVVGKYFKDAVELVMSSGVVLKNAVGVLVLVVIAIITLLPVLKIAAMAMTFYLTAALVEPVGEKELACALQDMGKGLIYIFATVAAVGLMFFLTIVIVTGVGNLSAMLQ